MQMEISREGSSYSLGAAVLLYQKKSGFHWDNKGQAIATVHHIETVNGRPVIQAGRPMNEADYSNMVKALSPKEQPSLSWVDPSILAAGMGRLIWWTPPMKRPMFFKTSEMAEGTFDGQAVCPVPGMVWQAFDDALFVYAVKGDTRPQKDTPLYQAPLFNVWARGQVCAGNAQAPRNEAKKDPAAWEHFLFGSHFTHPNFPEKDRLVKGIEPVAFWKEMLATPPESFPEDVLVPVTLKVEDLLAPDFRTRVSGMRAQGEF